MLTYNKDIYKCILKPIDIRYFTDSSLDGKYISPGNVQTTWRMLFPFSIRNNMQISEFTPLNKGEADAKRGTDSRRLEVKRHLGVRGSTFYTAMADHIDNMIHTNAAIKTYVAKTGKKTKYNELFEGTLTAFIAENTELVQKTEQAMLRELSFCLGKYQKEYQDDPRIPDNLKEFILKKIDTEPKVVLEILLFLSLFTADDKDEDFYTGFSEHYCEENIYTEYDTSDRAQVSEVYHELTSTTVLGAEFDSVLFREEEFHDISDLLESNKKKNIVLSGFGGCGKTSIARLLYGALKEKYDYYGWVNYTGNLKQSMISSVRMDDYNDDTMTENDSDKKWKYILKKLANTKESKLLVIDNVDYIDGIQNPLRDKELMALSGWNNVKVIVTSRLAGLPGFGEAYRVKNLGDATEYENCVNLFYHYNQEALKYKDENIETVYKLCEMAGFNTMVIELLAKGSRYDYHSLDEFYDRLKKVGFRYVNDVPVETAHDYNILNVADEDTLGNGTQEYYDIGNETAASQLMKLFNLKTRSRLERMILWDFHCLPEAEKVSREELQGWMGYSIKDINPLKEEGWINYADGRFSIHPLIRQAIACSEEDWHTYWEYGEQHREEIKPQETLVMLVKKHKFYQKEDGFDISLRKIRFTDYLTYGGEPLESETLLYIADNARKRGARDIGVKYYEEAYFKLRKRLYDADILSESFVKMSEEKLPQKPLDIADPLQIGQINLNVSDDYRTVVAELFWRCTYYYGYMVSYTVSGYDKSAMLILQAYYVLLGIGESRSAEIAKRLARTLDHLGYILSNYKKDNCAWVLCAEYYLKTAISLRKKIVEADPQEDIGHLHDLAWSQDNLGNLYAMLDPDLLDAGTTIVLEVSPLVSALLGFDVDAIMLSGDTLVNDLKNRVIYQKAERYLREALEVRERIARQIGYDHDTEVAWTLCNLARLLAQDTHRHTEAEKMILRALHLYEELDKTYPEQHLSSAARTYRAYARLLEQWEGRMPEAVECLEKALRLNEKLESDYPGIYIGEIEQIQKELNGIRGGGA